MIAFSVRLIVAAILLAAATLKFHGIVTGALTSAGLAVPVWITTTIALVEALVAWQLIAYRQRALPVFTGLILFGFLLIAAFSYWLAGAAECNCFGFLVAHPSGPVLIDISCLVSLWLVRPVHFLQNLRREVRAWKHRIANRHGVSIIATASIVVISIPCLFGT
ncbi:MAG: hypothetical protein WD851_08715 [Pirellulales bacterium]